MTISIYLPDAPLRIDAIKVEKLAARGLTSDVIADFLGMARDEFKTVLADDPAVDAAWRRGRANLQAKTMEWLVISARKGSVQAQIYLADRVLGAEDAGEDPTDRATAVCVKSGSLWSVMSPSNAGARV
jgi:hypothetical protein